MHSSASVGSSLVGVRPFTLGLALLALVVPCGVNAWAVPSTTFLNQVCALVGWGLWLTTWLPLRGMPDFRASLPGWVALGVLGGWIAAGGLGSGLALMAVGMVAAAAVVMGAGALLSDHEVRRDTFMAFALALGLAGLASLAMGAIQHFGPTGWGDPWISPAPASGRVGANLRQPNHLSSLLLSAMAAWVFVHEALRARSPLRAKTWGVVLAVMLALMVGGVVLTASRTGAVCVLLLAGWGLCDARLSRTARLALGVLPLLYAAWWFGFGEWAQAHQQTFVGDKQLNAADISSSRFAIWANTLELIRQNPWTGVGWGEFNFAWTLTPFPDRPVAFFDHTHNLPLQLWVELGVPLGTVVLVLLAWALWQAFALMRRATGPEAPLRAAAFVMVLMMGVHSLLEYPLWYAYFLLPTAFAWGLCLAPLDEASASGAEPPTTVRRLTWAVRLAGLLMAAGALLSMFDYQRIVRIFVPPANAAPLDQRIADGQKSIFFDHHAHYAAATTAPRPSDAMPSFKVATHFLLDTRLMMAWARALNEAGETDKARHVAARLKEFRNPGSAAFFAECDKPLVGDEKPPFQCEAPQRHYTFRDFY